MNHTDSLEALQRSNPRRQEGFVERVDQLTRNAREVPEYDRRPNAPRRWRAIGIPVGAALVGAAVILVAVGSPLGPLTVSPAEAVEQAAVVSAQAAEGSGTVVVEITKDGAVWVAKTIRWNGGDLAITNNDQTRVKRGDMLIVDGMMYGPDPEVVGGWIELGPPSSVDPDSGTTPDEYLTAIGEDVGGDTFRRITAEMVDLTTSQTAEGFTVYQGRVPAGALARETGFKDGEALRVLPYGNVANDNASDPSSMIDVSIAVGADGTIAEILAAWGGSSSWIYRLNFSDLGTTAPLEKPDNVVTCLRCRLSD